jgi:hypothetical protein
LAFFASRSSHRKREGAALNSLDLRLKWFYKIHAFLTRSRFFDAFFQELSVSH